MKSEPITCTPRTLGAGRAIKAASVACDINPMNRPMGIGTPDFSPTPEGLAVMTSKYWGAAGVRLTVGFVNRTSAALRDRILSHMNAWGGMANIEFTWTDEAADATVRINRERMASPEWNGYWSFLGTDIIRNHGPANQTMNLEAFTMRTTASEFHRVVRHETGHTLGFPHEHMREELVRRIDRSKAIAYYRRVTGWGPAQVVQQVLTPLESRSIRGTSHADPNSIMAYQVPGSVTKDGKPIVGGADITESDYRFSALIYPKLGVTHRTG